MHHIDAMGGAGKDSEANRKRLDYDAATWRAATSRPAPPSPPPAARRGAREPPEGMMPRGEPRQRQQRRTGRTKARGSGLPGADTGSPTPAQLNSRPTERHQH